MELAIRRYFVRSNAHIEEEIADATIMMGLDLAREYWTATMDGRTTHHGSREATVDQQVDETLPD